MSEEDRMSYMEMGDFRSKVLGLSSEPSANVVTRESNVYAMTEDCSLDLRCQSGNMAFRDTKSEEPRRLKTVSETMPEREKVDVSLNRQTQQYDNIAPGSGQNQRISVQKHVCRFVFLGLVVGVFVGFLSSSVVWLTIAHFKDKSVNVIVNTEKEKNPLDDVTSVINPTVPEPDETQEEKMSTESDKLISATAVTETEKTTVKLQTTDLDGLTIADSTVITVYEEWFANGTDSTF